MKEIRSQCDIIDGVRETTPADRRLEPARTGTFDEIVSDLARFRYTLRIFLRFSENAARAAGVTPQQHQLMLGVAGFTGRGSATISELAEFLQERNHSVVGLVARAARRGLVHSEPDSRDRRVVVVSLTSAGKRLLARLSRLHHQEIARVRAELTAAPPASNPAAPERDSG